MDIRKKIIDKILPTRPPNIRGGGSILDVETNGMHRQRRLGEQQGQQNFGRVNVREHPENESHHNFEADVKNDVGLLDHPELDTPRFDGADIPYSVIAYLDPESKRKFENERRNQEQEKQLRLGNMPKMGRKYEPPRPGG